MIGKHSLSEILYTPVINNAACFAMYVQILLDEYPGLGVLSDSLVAVCDKFGIHVR